CAVFTYLFLEIEQQWEVAALAIGALAVMLVMRGRAIGTRVERSAAASPRTAVVMTMIAVLIVAAALHESHFALLMLATVALFVTVCLGLTIQFGYAGIVNFAGAAFFGMGCYTTAVLAAHTPLPHIAVIAASGLTAALIGSILI